MSKHFIKGNYFFQTIFFYIYNLVYMQRLILKGLCSFIVLLQNFQFSLSHEYSFDFLLKFWRFFDALLLEKQWMDFLFLYIAISFKNKVYLAKLTNFVLVVNYSHFPFFHTLHIFTNTLYKTTKKKIFGL